MSINIEIIKKMNGFTLDIKFRTKSKITGILGASGSGKSMTLKCIAGIEKPDKGIICLNDNLLFNSEEKVNIKTQKRKVGYLFQNYALFPNMTVKQNILSGITDKTDKKKVLEKMLKIFRLKGLENHRPYQLSGGQQQRVALARIFAYEPEILLLDEPFSALDTSLKDHIQMELLDILSSYDKDVILVSHSRDEIFRFCDDIVIIDEGKSILHSGVKEIFSKPRYKNVANLIGIKNIRECRIINDNVVYIPEWGETLMTREKIHKDIRYVGIRARDIELCENNNGQENYIKVDIIKVSHEFNFISLFCRPLNMRKELNDDNDNITPNILVKIPRNKWKYEYSKMKYIKINKSDIILLKDYV